MISFPAAIIGCQSLIVVSAAVYITMFWSKKEKKAKQGEKEERKEIEPLPPKVSEREFVNEKSEQAANAFIQSMIDQVGKLSQMGISYRICCRVLQ